MTPKTMYSYRLEHESSEFESVWIEAVKPSGLRDAWRVLRGRCCPELRVRRRPTVEGWSRAIMDAAEAVRAQASAPCLLYTQGGPRG